MSYTLKKWENLKKKRKKDIFKGKQTLPKVHRRKLFQQTKVNQKKDQPRMGALCKKDQTGHTGCPHSVRRA